jgi:steroid delta-isomerase-like uncharacterized protein
MRNYSPNSAYNLLGDIRVSNCNKKGGIMMTTDVKKMFEDYGLAWSSYDVEKIASFFTDDCIYEDVATGAVNHGKKELKDFINGTFAAFPDFKIELRPLFVAGDWVGMEWIMSGTHKGDLPLMPATGKGFSIRGASVSELHEGKLRRNTDYWNLASFLQQVGLMPVPASPSG